jgi:hypothetical protein
VVGQAREEVPRARNRFDGGGVVDLDRLDPRETRRDALRPEQPLDERLRGLAVVLLQPPGPTRRTRPPTGPTTA